jgi:uncharacterized protein YcbX
LPTGSGAIGIVADLWRYPVKSFGGERLRRVFCGPFGLLGDRRAAVTDAEGAMTARRAPGLLGFRASYIDPDAAEHISIITPEGDSLGLHDEALQARLADALPTATSLATSPLGFFDAAPLHILGEPSIAALASEIPEELDRRRFRANILVEPAGGAAFEEDGWIGRRLAIGDALVEIVVNTERCAVTTFDPDTLERDPRVLKALATTRENLFGVYARVLKPGWIATGDRIRPALTG